MDPRASHAVSSERAAAVPSADAVFKNYGWWIVPAGVLMLGVVVALVFALVTLQHYRSMDNSRRDVEAKYRSLLERSTDAIMTLTPSKGFLECNLATCQLFACQDKREFTSLAPPDLSPEYQPDGTLSSVKAQQMMEMAIRNGSHFFEWDHKRKTGEVFPATVLLSRIPAQGEVVLQAMVRDITDLKRAQQELVEQYKAAEVMSVTLKKQVAELEMFNQAAVGRELRMIQLKQEINALLAEQGWPPKYEDIEETAAREPMS